MKKIIFVLFAMLSIGISNASAQIIPTEPTFTTIESKQKVVQNDVLRATIVYDKITITDSYTLEVISVSYELTNCYSTTLDRNFLLDPDPDFNRIGDVVYFHLEAEAWRGPQVGFIATLDGSVVLY